MGYGFHSDMVVLRRMFPSFPVFFAMFGMFTVKGLQGARSLGGSLARVTGGGGHGPEAPRLKDGVMTRTYWGENGQRAFETCLLGVVKVVRTPRLRTVSLPETAILDRP